MPPTQSRCAHSNLLQWRPSHEHCSFHLRNKCSKIQPAPQKQAFIPSSNVDPSTFEAHATLSATWDQQHITARTRRTGPSETHLVASPPLFLLHLALPFALALSLAPLVFHRAVLGHVTERLPHADCARDGYHKSTSIPHLALEAFYIRQLAAGPVLRTLLAAALAAPVLPLATKSTNARRRRIPFANSN
jgi:hypothetical protein